MRRLIRENAYRDLWLLAVSIMVLFGFKALSDKTAEIQEGRKTGTTITCVITSSILRGSHNFIVASSSAPLPGKIEARLVKEGYPRKAEREQEGVRSADSYTTAVANAVVAAAGNEARGLIAETSPAKGKHGPAAGTLNCARLKTLTKAR